MTGVKSTRYRRGNLRLITPYLKILSSGVAHRLSSMKSNEQSVIKVRCRVPVQFQDIALHGGNRGSNPLGTPSFRTHLVKAAVFSI